MSDRPIHEVLAEISAKVPPEEWAKLDKTHYADPDTLATLNRLERENADLRARLEAADSVVQEQEIVIGLIAKALKVSDEPHQGFNARVLEAAEAAERDAIPVSDILDRAAHVAANGAAVARFGGQNEDEGRCRVLCAMYLRELVHTFRMKQKIAAIDAAIAKEWK